MTHAPHHVDDAVAGVPHRAINPWPVLLVLLTAWVLTERLLGTHAQYSQWSDRELWRALHVGDAVPWRGAELSGSTGPRIPGGASAWVLTPGTWLGAGPYAPYRWTIVLEALGALAFGHAIARVAGFGAATLAVAVWIGHPISAVTMGQLWNPALLALPVGIAWWGLLRALTDDARGIVLFFAGTALALQMHLTAVGLLLGGIAALALARPPKAAPMVGLGLVAATIAYAPFIYGEITHGFPTLNGLAAQPDLHGDAWLRSPVDNLRGLVDKLRLEPLTWLPELAVWAQRLGRVPGDLLLVGAIAAGTLTLSCRARHHVRMAGMAVAAVSFAILLADGAIHVGAVRSERYLYVAWSGVAVVLGMGWSSMPRWGRHALGGVACAVVILTQLAAPRRSTIDLSLADAAALTAGPDAASRIARTVVVRDLQIDPYLAVNSVDGLLAARGQRFPGAQPPPCFLAVPPHIDIGAESLATIFGESLPGARILERSPHSRSYDLVTYTTDAPFCRTSMVQKYVPLPEEQALEAMPIAARVTRVQHHDAQRFVVPIHDRHVAIDVREANGIATATIVGRPLRGAGWNAGWLADWTWFDVAFEAQTEEGAIRVPVASRLGAQGVPTPVTVVLPKGTQALSLRWQPTTAAPHAVPNAEGPATTIPLGTLDPMPRRQHDE